jgi:hypothetical protein
VGLEERAANINRRTPDLIADVTLYKTEEGGRRGPAPPGWGCPTAIASNHSAEAWDAWPQLGDEPLKLGETRRAGFVFFSPQGAETMRRAGKFYLFESGCIGEATVVST